MTCSKVLGKKATGNLVCNSDCTINTNNCEAQDDDTKKCLDGTLFGECSEVTEGMQCVDGSLKISATCCAKVGKSVDLDKNVCVSINSCNPLKDEITCVNGIESTCNKLPDGTGIWRTTRTCEAEYCKLNEGCINDEPESVNTYNNTKPTVNCELDSCQEGCDRTGLPKVCGINAKNEYKLFKNKCELVDSTGWAYAGNEAFCNEQLNKKTNTLLFVLVGLFVLIVILGVGNSLVKR